MPLLIWEILIFFKNNSSVGAAVGHAWLGFRVLTFAIKQTYHLSYDTTQLSHFVIYIYTNTCVVKECLGQNINILVNCAQSQSIGLILGVCCSGVECHYVFLLLIP